MPETSPELDAALYYPYINFRDESWLKLAVLYWDVISRITSHEAAQLDPPQYWPSQPHDMRLLEQHGIVRPFIPNVEHAALNDIWRQLLARHAHELARVYALNLDQRADLADTSSHARGYAPGPMRRKKGVGWLLEGKLERDLFEDLAHAKLATRGSDVGAPGWVALDERLLDVYMTTLANQVVGHKPVETVTDVPGHFRRFTENSLPALQAALLPHGTSATNAPSDDAGMLVMTLAIDAVSPAGIQALPMDAVLALRTQSRDARTAFKAGTATLVQQIIARRDAALDGQLDPRDLEELRETHIDKPLKELKKAFRNAYGEAALSILTLKSPLESGTLGATMLTAAGASSPVLAGVGVALGLFQMLTGAKKRREEVRKSPLAWLLDIESKLDGEAAS